MNLADMFFEALFTATEKEIERLLACGLLDHYRRDKRHAWAVNKILQESTLRYLGLRGLYELVRDHRPKFDMEVSHGKGPIDLLLLEGPDEYAFELKRWQVTESAQISSKKDYDNLVSFLGMNSNRHAHAVVFTNNQHVERDSKEKFTRGYYEGEFQKAFGHRYCISDVKVRSFEDFTICAALLSVTAVP